MKFCPRCQGRGGYAIGPMPGDHKTCHECKGNGYPGGIDPYDPTGLRNHAATARVSTPTPPSYATLEEMLEGIDVVNHKLRDKHLDVLRDAMRRNVSVIADHRIHDGDFTILVSPGDYSRLKQEKTNGT